MAVVTTARCACVQWSPLSPCWSVTWTDSVSVVRWGCRARWQLTSSADLAWRLQMRAPQRMWITCGRGKQNDSGFRFQVRDSHTSRFLVHFQQMGAFMSGDLNKSKTLFSLSREGSSWSFFLKRKKAQKVLFASLWKKKNEPLLLVSSIQRWSMQLSFGRIFPLLVSMSLVVVRFCSCSQSLLTSVCRWERREQVQYRLGEREHRAGRRPGLGDTDGIQPDPAGLGRRQLCLHLGECTKCTFEWKRFLSEN